MPRGANRNAYGATPSAGGETPEGAWNKADTDGSMDVAMDVETKEKKGSVQSKMKVISGDDGHLARVPNLSMNDYSIKIGLTLYKVQQNIYLLDFQKVNGDAFSFMTLCANIITELKTLSAASKQAQQALLAQQQAAAAQQHSMQGGRYHSQGMSK